MSSILSEIKQSMYEYEVITAQQLGVIHSYSQGKNSIYPNISKLHKNQEVRKADVPQIGRGSKAYFLSQKAAKQAAEARQEAHLFKEKDWETAPGSILNILIANQFFCELIRNSRDIPKAGLSEWVGRRTLSHRYLAEQVDKKDRSQHLMMNGFGVFHHNDVKQFIHLDVFTGNETSPAIQDKLMNHYECIRANWEFPQEVLLIIVYLGNRTGERITKLWNRLVEGNQEVPYLATANFEQLGSKGYFSSEFISAKGEKVSLFEMPSVKDHHVPDPEDFIGKQKKIKFQFSTISGFQGHEISKSQRTKSEFELEESEDRLLTEESISADDKQVGKDEHVNTDTQEAHYIEQNNEDIDFGF